MKLGIIERHIVGKMIYVYRFLRYDASLINARSFESGKFPVIVLANDALFIDTVSICNSRRFCKLHDVRNRDDRDTNDVTYRFV